MVSQAKIRFLGQDFVYEKSEESWELALKRSDVGTQDMNQLLLLNLHHPLFLEQTMKVDEDEVHFRYALEADGLSLAAVKQRTRSEQLRLALNLLDLEACLSLPVTFFLHPDNLFITKDERFKIAYRAVPEVMTPKSLDAAEFLKQVKCYLVALFSRYRFSELYDGSLEVVEVPAFLASLRQKRSLAELREELTALYQEELAQEAARLSLVKTARYKLYKYAAIWLTALAVMLLIPLVYLVFIRNPFKEKLLEADTAFIKVDYSGVISELKSVDVADLPYTQKYELAYAYIQNLSFSDDQKAVILNNVTLKSDELYLDYWIQAGRGAYEEALDIAKRLDDSDLILYAIAQEMVAVREDDSLSGSEREEQLSELQSDYDKYWEDRTSTLTDASGHTSADSSATETSE